MSKKALVRATDYPVPYPRRPHKTIGEKPVLVELSYYWRCRIRKNELEVVPDSATAQPPKPAKTAKGKEGDK